MTGNRRTVFKAYDGVHWLSSWRERPVDEFILDKDCLGIARLIVTSITYAVKRCFTVTTESTEQHIRQVFGIQSRTCLFECFLCLNM